MASPTQFRHYYIAQNAGGGNIEVVRTSDQVAVLAFDSRRQTFVHCHVLLEPVQSQESFEKTARKLSLRGHPLRARLLEFGEDDGSSFYITENVDGETVQDYLDRRETVPAWLGITLAIKALSAVKAMLELGDYLPTQVLQGLRLVQTGSQSLSIVVADYRLVDGAAPKPGKAKVDRAGFEKAAKFLDAYVGDRLQEALNPADVSFQAIDLKDLLEKVLKASAPGLEGVVEAFIKGLEKRLPGLPDGEIPAPLKPRPFLSSYLASFQELARAVSQSVRIQSQKLAPAQPYALRGMLLKTGQSVVVEQVPPKRMVGSGPSLAVRQVQGLPKVGKFPNLVPVVHVEEHEEVESMAETAVEGVSLSELLEVRGVLDTQETYIVLAGMDAALAQVQKASLTTHRLRLEDTFLFTGFGTETPVDSGLLTKPLNEWPGFSIVVRAHPCVHSMAGRGTDPGLLLPLEIPAKGDAEPVWHGGWMAALACFLAGMPSGDPARHATGVPQTDTIFALLEDELKRSHKGSPSSRAAFLARYAKLVQKYDLVPAKPGGLWQELSGAAAAPVVEAVEVRPVTTLPAKKGGPPPPMPLSSPEAPAPQLGFAEALIQRSGQLEPPLADEPGLLRPMRTGMRLQSEPVESSWTSIHHERPLWQRAGMFVGGSICAGLVLAHLSGRALWQHGDVDTAPPTPVVIEPPPQTDVIDLPVLPESPPPIPKVEASSPAPAAPSKAATPALVPAVTPMVLPAMPAPVPDSVAATQMAPLVTPSSVAPVPVSVPAPSPLPMPPLPVAASPLPVPAPAIPPVPASSMAPAPELVPKAVPYLPPGANVSLDPAVAASLEQARLAGGKLSTGQRISTEKAAKAGVTEAMVALGRSYLPGSGAVVDEKMGFEWIQKAHSAGDPKALVPLAECHLLGWGTPANPTQAAALLEQAVAGNNPVAKNILGMCYSRGVGVGKSDARAFTLCSEAYADGVTSACGNLGTLYLHGQGVAPDAERAVAFFSEGAKKGDSESMRLLAQCLEYGTGTLTDRVEASLWYQKSARLGNAEAISWCRQKSVAF